jgi:RhtB (resistance to homoserine/threonine) family protein
MIDLHNYLLFIAGSIVLVIVPGPDMAYMLGRTLTQGRKAGYWAVVGINTGAYFHLLTAILGLSAIIATSAVLFTVVKFAGACYLIWLGMQALLAKPNTFQVSRFAPCLKPKVAPIFWQGFLSNVLNPKVVLFYFTFFPQFIGADSEHHTRQLIILGVTLNIIAISINIIMVYFVGLATSRFKTSQRLTHWLNRAMGTVFIALGLRLAMEKS